MGSNRVASGGLKLSKGDRSSVVKGLSQVVLPKLFTRGNLALLALQGHLVGLESAYSLQR